MIIIMLITSILIPISAGYVCLLMLFQRQKLPMSLMLALSYGLGVGVLSLWMLCLFIVQNSFSLNLIRLPFVFGTILMLILYSLTKVRTFNSIHKKASQTQNLKLQYSWINIVRFIFIGFLIIYCAQNMLYVIWRSMTMPISSWDAIATIAFKAKVFFYEPTLPSLNLLPHQTYPLFVPFMESWIAFNLGYWDDLLVKIIFPCAFLSYLTIHYKFLSHFTSKTWALLGCAILLSSNFFIYHATISYRDFFMMYFNCITVMLLIYWNQNKNNSFLILASLFAGFASFTKLEGTAFLVVYLAIYSLMNFRSKNLSKKDKLVNSIKFLVPSFGICLTFHLYKIMNNIIKEGSNINDKTKFDFSWEKISHIPDILQSFIQNMMFSGNWNIIWVVALVSLLHLRMKKRNPEGVLVLLSLVLFFGLYFLVALFTVNYTWIAGDQNVTTLSRLILHFYPLSVLLIVLLNYSALSAEGNNTSSLNPIQQARNK